MKAKDVLPQSIVGALIMVVLLIIIDGYAAVVAKSQLSSSPDSVLWPLLAMVLLAFAVGGFIAAYIAARKAKDALDRALAASSLSAIITVLAVGLLSFLSILMTEDGSLLVATLNLLAMFMLLGIVGVGMSVTGGLVLGAILGYGKSMVAASFKRGWAAFRKSPSAILVPLLLSLVLFASMVVSRTSILQGGNEDLIALVAMLVISLLAAFTISSVIAAMQKRQKPRGLLRQSIKSGKDVFVALVAIAVPPTVVALLLFYGMMAAPGFDALWTLLFMLFAAAAVVYLFVFSLVPQSMVLSKKRVRQAFADSYKRVRAHWLAFVGLLSMILLINIVAEIVLFGVDFVAFSVGGDSSLLTAWILMAVSIIVSSAALTGFYMEAKK